MVVRNPPLEQRVAPGSTAVVVVDMQNDFVDPEGANCRWWRDRWANEGADLSGIERLQGPVVTTIDRLVAAARAAGVPVVWAQTVNTEATIARFWASENQILCTKGSWGAEQIAALRPDPGDVVLTKTRHSAFHGTDLEAMLRERGIEGVVVVGTATHGCVEATMRDAMTLDLWAVAAGDGCGQGDQPAHDVALVRMDRLFGMVVDADEVIAAWGSGS